MKVSNARLLLSLILVCRINNCFAGNVDLELQMNIDIAEFVEFQQTGAFSVTLTNHGPDDAGGESGLSHPNDVISTIIKESPNGFRDVSFYKDINVIQECIFITIVGDPPPGGTVSWGFDIVFPMVPANSSVTCYGVYHVGFEQGNRVVDWFVLPSIEDNDINSTNNKVTFSFNIAPTIIPSTNQVSVLLLIGLILVFGYRFSKMRVYLVK